MDYDDSLLIPMFICRDFNEMIHSSSRGSGVEERDVNVNVLGAGAEARTTPSSLTCHQDSIRLVTSDKGTPTM